MSVSDTSENNEKLLSDIKMLIILQLLNDNTPQSHIATMLGISEATMSRMLPKGFTATIRKDRNYG